MQAIIVAVCSFVLAVVFGKLLIPVLRALKAGQSIREIGPSWHNSKAGTPTMGGLVFIAAAALCTIAGGWRSMLAGNLTHLYVLAFALVFGVIGFLDDFINQHFCNIIRQLINRLFVCRGLRLWVGVCFFLITAIDNTHIFIFVHSPDFKGFYDVVLNLDA